MAQPKISLNDRYDLSVSPVLLSGTQALVRLLLMQAARDRAIGLNTAGLVSGYRGSPVGGVDMVMQQAQQQLSAANILFQPGLNEDLAATAIWGSQQAELRGEGRYDGVFGLWYGKGPGVDRTGDALRHANMAGTSKHGGVLFCMGDDHTGESSSVCHQSDWAVVDAYLPVLSPAGVQEILDLGLYGFALSRFSGLWAGLKLMKDTVEVSSVVDGSLERMSFVTPEFRMPDGGLNIRLGDHWVPQEARLIDYKRYAAEAFANANKIDKRVWGRPGAKIGFVAAGKNWLDLQHALSLLGIDAARAEALGLTTYKVAQTFPLDMASFHDWAEGLDLIVIVEEKRKLIEVQVKEAIFDDRRGRRVYGWYKGGAGGLHRAELFPVRMALEPVMIAEKLGEILQEEGRGSEDLAAALERLRAARRAENVPEIQRRMPYFCSGCPHNSSTKLPEGSRAYAGIGCHIMALWMDRETSGFTHMGGEGANWIGEAPFSKMPHVFQNMGDGTYNHSGVQSIRAALAAGTTITFKILFNDAVAMTGGQRNEGGLTAARIAAELRAMGVKTLEVVVDEKEGVDSKDFPGLTLHPRENLMLVQDKLRQTKGVSVLLYIQACAAEKRRRRRRGSYPEGAKRIFINPDVCEGCGDCGVQSNCVSVVPKETEFGTKRAIDQSSCNADYSCVQGFCPSFVSIYGAKIKQKEGIMPETSGITLPELPAINHTHNTVITGIGGTGVVTIGAVLAMAAHLDGKGVGLMEMAGLAQKGGAVLIHLRIADDPAKINAIRVALGEADTIIGGDLVVTATSSTLALASPKTRAVVNLHETTTGDFTRNRDFRIQGAALRQQLELRLPGGLHLIDSSKLALVALGDAIYSNAVLLGAVWQAGQLPLSLEAVEEAIRLNGTAAERNLQAFALGRWAIANPEAAARLIAPTEPQALPKTLAGEIAVRAQHLTAYQNAGLARRYQDRLSRIGDENLRQIAAKSYHKLLSYKDEYEVARLHLSSAAQIAEQLEDGKRLTFHLAPPILGGKDARGRPKKREFGPWVLGLFSVLARLKPLRGTAFDPFGYTAERRAERALIAQYEADMDLVLRLGSSADPALAQELLALPMEIRGFGPVKVAAMAKAAKRRDEILAALSAEPTRIAAE